MLADKVVELGEPDRVHDLRFSPFDLEKKLPAFEKKITCHQNRRFGVFCGRNNFFSRPNGQKRTTWTRSAASRSTTLPDNIFYESTWKRSRKKLHALVNLACNRL